MIGVYHNENKIVFCSKGKGGKYDFFEAPFDTTSFSLDSLKTVLDAARKELRFSLKTDYRIAVDFPLCHSTAQNVPYAQQQLDMVLENYLEEELPENMDNFAFDYHCFESKDNHSAIVAFWLRRDLLAAWTDLAEEYSINSIDFQPAELALLPPNFKDPVLTLRLGPGDQIRYGCFQIIDLYPSLSLGMFHRGTSAEKAAKILSFTGTGWNRIQLLQYDPELEHLKPLAGALGIEKTEVKTDDHEHAFAIWACEADRISGQLLFRYRKGEFAPKGLAEKITAPILLLAFSIMAVLSVLIYQNMEMAKNLNTAKEELERRDKKYWKQLLPDARYESSRTAERMDSHRELLSGSGRDEDNVHQSALQMLGKAFKGITSDEKLLVTEINIDLKAINIDGLADNHEDIAAFENELNDNPTFEDSTVKISGNKDGKSKFRINIQPKPEERQ